MTITIDWQNKLVLSDASITDIVVFKETIREFEDDAVGMLNPQIIAYKRVDLGGGAYFHDVPFINGWQLKFPTPGNYTVVGNIGATIVPVAGVFVDRTKSAAFSTTSSGGSGPSSADIAAATVAALMAAAQTTPIHAEMRKINGVTLVGSGTSGDPMRPA
jgi:hypothetical protein